MNEINSFQDEQINLAIKGCEERNVLMIKELCPNVVSPNVILPTYNKNGIKLEKATLLHIAAFSGARECVDFLIEYGAKVDTVDE